MANKVELAVSIDDNTRSGQDSIVSGAQQTQRTLTEQHAALLAEQKAATDRFVAANSAAFLDAAHADHDKVAASFEALMRRQKKAEDKFLEERTKPLTPATSAAADAGRAIAEKQQRDTAQDAGAAAIAGPQSPNPWAAVAQPAPAVDPIDEQTIQQSAKVAGQAMDALRADTQELMTAFQRLRADGLDNASDADIARFTRLGEKLDATRQKVAGFAAEMRTAGQNAGETGRPLQGFADAIEREVAQGKTALEGFTAKVTQEENEQRIAATRTANIIDEVRDQQAMASQRRAEQAATAFVQAEAEQQAAAQKTAGIIGQVREQQRTAGIKAAEATARAFLDGEQAAEEMASREAAVTAQTQAVILKIQQLGQEITATAAKSRDLWSQADEQDRAAADIRKVTDAIRASGDASDATKDKLAALESQEQQLGSSAAALRTQALGHEAAARAAASQTQGLVALAGTEERAAAEANKLAATSRNVTESLDSAALARYRADLAKLAQQYQATAQTANAATGAMRQGGYAGGQGMLQLAYAVDDVQYGLRGIINNIPMLVQSLGGTAKLAGVVGIIAVAVSVLSRHMDSLGKSVGFVMDSFAKMPLIGEAIKGVKEFVSIVEHEAVSALEKLAAVSTNLGTTITKGSDAAVAAYREQFKEYTRHASHLEAIKLGIKSVADAQKTASAQTLVNYFKEAESLEEKRNKLLAIEALLKAGGKGSAKVLGDQYDTTEPKKNVEALLKMHTQGVQDINGSLEAQRVLLRTLEKDANAITDARKREHDRTLELISANEELRRLDQQRAAVLGGDPLAVQVQRSAELRRIAHERIDIERELAGLGRDPASDDKRVKLLERQATLGDDELRIQQQQGDAAAQLRQIDEAKIKAREEAEKRLAGEEGRTAQALHEAAADGKADKDELARLQAAHDDAQKARQKNQSALEHDRDTAKQRRGDEATKRELDNVKLLADTKRQAEANLDQQREANLQRELARLDKLKQALATKDGDAKPVMERLNEAVDDRAVAAQTLRNRKAAAQQALNEGLAAEGMIDQNGKAVGNTKREQQANQLELNNRRRKLNADVEAGFNRDQRNGQVDGEENANARQQLLGGIVGQGQAQNRINAELAGQLRKLIDEQADAAKEQARIAAQVKKANALLDKPKREPPKADAPAAVGREAADDFADDKRGLVRDRAENKAQREFVGPKQNPPQRQRAKQDVAAQDNAREREKFFNAQDDNPNRKPVFADDGQEGVTVTDVVTNTSRDRDERFEAQERQRQADGKKRNAEDAKENRDTQAAEELAKAQSRPRPAFKVPAAQQAEHEAESRPVRLPSKQPVAPLDQLVGANGNDEITIEAVADTDKAEQELDALTKPREAVVKVRVEEPAQPQAAAPPADQTGQQVATALQASSNAIRQISNAQAGLNRDQTDATQKLTSMVTDALNLIAQNRDAIGQVSEHVNGLQSQLVAQSNSATIRSLRAGAV